MIIAIESSCDESAIACFDPLKGFVQEWVSSQISLHAEYGGVVPDLASREHLGHFEAILKDLQQKVNLGDVCQMAVTIGPGLAACLAVGLTVAKAMSLSCGVPLCGVNHLRGHVYSPFIPLHAHHPAGFRESLPGLLPHLSLVVSGGNTLLVKVDRDLNLEVLADTVDDAAGEAIDKGAKLMGLAYPGGPVIESLAKGGKCGTYTFPVSFPSPQDRRFSFSGLKTSLRYTIEKMDDAAMAAALPDLCASYQQAVIDQLIRKTAQVFDQGCFQSIGLSGGVSNNQCLREHFQALGRRYRVPALLAERRHTGDNAGMIAFAAWLHPSACLSHHPDSPLLVQPSLTLV
jgi:N6-L-threonylcarbamoyladenine synthase